ncbi:MAG TPA: RNA 2',3'-cyclic phosphodiesterase [Gammaproteobacteria bacterium]|nr:RNA 2',3'-cyclic phosphodiesterase [Gammaproteobacteria bacterium]
MSPADQKPLRLFLALWPDQTLREAIHNCSNELLVAQQDWHGRLVDKRNLHMTLAFLGSVATDRLDCIKKAAASLCWQAFTLQLDQPGFWDRARVAWLAPTDIPQQLTDLEQQLRRSLVTCGFAQQQRDYHPHVTLARKCRAPESSDVPAPLQQSLVWEVNNLVLVSSVTDPAGVRYEVIGRWQPDKTS